MAGWALLDALSALIDRCSWNQIVVLLCCAGTVFALGLPAVQAVARCVMVLLLMPLLILTTVLNYHLRRAGKDILPMDFLKYLCGQETQHKPPQAHISVREKKNRMRTAAPEFFGVGKKKES